MKKDYDVIIIGGGPSGIIAGVTGKKQNPDKSFLMLKEEAKGLVPCGIPYIFHTLNDVSKNEMGPKPFVDAGGEVYVNKAVEIDLANQELTTQDGSQFGFKKLVFATGSNPVIPRFIPGWDLEGVEYIKKSYDYIKALKAKTDVAKKIVILGGGFIGVEVAEQLAMYPDKIVSLVEMESCCLIRAFSPDVAARANEVIRDTGIQLYTKKKVVEITGESGKVTGVRLDDGTEIEAEIVISAIGYKPNTALAEKAGLALNKNGAIIVDRYMRAGLPDIFAIGDCSQTVGFITGRTDNIMLASTATAEARVLGYNLFKINLIRNFAGTLSVFSTKINGITFASAGAIEQTAQEAGIPFVTGKFTDVDRHPGTLPDTSEVMVKLVVSPESGTIIGGEITGGDSVGEMVNIIALAIQKYVTIYELVSFQVGTHPLLTAAPTKYPLIKAAESAIAAIKNYRA